MSIDIGKTIATVRKSKGFTQAEMAKALKITQAAYSKIECSSTNVTMSRLEELAAIFQMEVDQVFNFAIENFSDKSAGRLSESERELYERLLAAEKKISELQARRIADLEKMLRFKNF